MVRSPSNISRLGLSFLITSIALACNDAPSIGQKSRSNDSEGGAGQSTTNELQLDVGSTTSSSNSTTTAEETAKPDNTQQTKCGNDILEVSESCDDGNTRDGDGCSQQCTTESGYACPTPGEKCVKLAVCGDGNLGVGEECDDTNSTSGDGCTDKCIVELGWECPTAGSRCNATRCGDGKIAGNEQCEDGGDPPESDDGCSANCRIETGYFCPKLGTNCQETVCGNGVREGEEPCDDGNADVGDGCTPLCEREPTCVDGACSSVCGDGLILAGDGEECDDGNQSNGDGCSDKCVQEKGYTCTLVSEAPPEELVIPIIYRDFVATGRERNGGVSHPDFNVFTGGGTKNLILATLKDGKPQFAGICDDDGPSDKASCPNGNQLTTEANFNEWYHDGSRSIRINRNLPLTRNQSGQYSFDSGASFFPLAHEGWVLASKESAPSKVNYSFTSELRYWFQIDGGEKLTFSGDDDVWVFINNQIMIDLGGLHSEKSASISLTDTKIAELGMTKGRIYEIVLFHAERRESQSNFRLTLNGFVKTKSVCLAECGDGIVAGDEVCDDGKNGGKYGYCKTDCSGLDARCGDAELQTNEQEQCDDGINLTSYDFAMTGEGCAPGCKLPSRCGDQVVDIAFGEQCDDGNLKDGDGCESNCTFRDKCGDKKVDAKDGEQCDDGNRKNNDGCSQFCTIEVDVIR